MTSIPSIISRVSSLTQTQTINLTHPESPFPCSDSHSDISLPLNSSNPISALLRSSSSSSSSLPTSLLSPCSINLITSLLPSLPDLVDRPLVLHLSTNGDHSDLLTLRSTGIPIFYSSTKVQAQAHSLLAIKLAKITQSLVIHYFDVEEDSKGASFEQVTDKDVVDWLSSDEKDLQYEDLPNGSSLSNGANGHTNGHSNGHSNGIDSSSSSSSSSISHSPARKSTSSLETILTSLYSSVSTLVGEQMSPYTLHGNDSSSDLAIVLGSHSSELSSDNLAVLEVSLVRPTLPNLLIKSLPKDVKRIATLERTLKRTTRLGPLFVDVALAFQTNEEGIKRPEVLIGGILAKVSSESSSSQSIVKSLEKSQNHFIIGNLEKKPSSSKQSTIVEQIKVPKHEEAYNVMLEQVFGERLSVINSAKGNDETSTHPSAKSPEYAFGQVLSQLEARDDLLLAVEEALRQGEIDDELHSTLSQYALSKDDSTRNKSIEAKFLTQISRKDIKPTEALKKIQSLSKHVESKSRWIIGSDSWAYDTGMSGVHHVISSGKNVNMLIFDSVPYTKRDSIVPEKRKKDIALYAMNYGNVYVASTAVYADYTQVLHALMEADKFNGPSIVLAYIPYRTENAPALDVLKETKLAVDSGYWPLFRWDPSNEDKAEKEVFRLDGVRMRESLKNFLERNNNLTLLANSKPQLSYDLAVSSGVGLREAQKSKAKKAYEALLGNMDGPPLLILYASDGGNAEKVAKKLSMRAKARGLASRCLTMDDFPLSDELKEEKNVAFISSTAGQGEFPQNGRETFKTLSKLDQGSLPDTVNFTVFGMGDSHYWPRAEDAHYYNKPAKDLDIKLESLGASRFSPLGLGDDQDSDGWQTGYKPWEANLWKSLGVDTVNVTEAEPEAINNEHMKIASNFLRGTIVEGLADTSTGAIAETDTQLTKFHGTYMQYDRDTLEERKNAGLEPAYSFMIRARIPGGVCTPDQWLQLDKVAGDYGNGTIKITTRQTIQYHCVVKSNLKKAMQGINKSMLDTIAACGDVNRNVMCSPNPALSQLHEDVYDFSKKISEHLLPRMDAYHEIWLDEETESKKKQLLVGGALQDYEPLYGAYYLPRKFKIAIAVPPRNDVDCFAHDIGLIAIADKTGNLQGFNLAVGGGMGVTHSMKITYPRLGDVLGFITPEQTLKVCETVMLIQRDTGNRANRKQARLKYTVDKVWGGAQNFKAELERRLGYKLEAEKPYKFEMNTDEYGWKKDYKGNWHCTLWLENGRVRDIPGDEFRTGLRELCKIHKGNLRLTPNQHIIISDITPDKKEEIDGHLRKWKMDNWNHSGLKLSASACVAFPTCGLAMAESERYLPELVDKVERIFEKNGLRNDEVTMRMTGCPNGCARPWVAEIAFVGKAPGTYLMLLGGGHAGERLNKIYRDNVTESDILEILTPMIARYAKERTDNEPFGDWVIRAGIIAPTTSGAEFYDNVNTEGDAPALEQKAKAAA